MSDFVIYDVEFQNAVKIQILDKKSFYEYFMNNLI